MVAVLKQAEVGVPVEEKRYVGLEIDQLRQLKQLQEQNKLLAELSLDKAMLQDVLGTARKKQIVFTDWRKTSLK